MLVDVSDDGDVTQVPRQGAACDAVRRIDPNESCPWHVQNRLEVPVDELAIILVDLRFVAKPEGRPPPRDVVVAGDRDDATYLSGIANECCSALEFAGSRALGQIAGNRH